MARRCAHGGASEHEMENRMIQKKTAYSIVIAYQEIEAGEKLLTQLDEALSHGELPDFRDHFGHQRGISLGVPNGDHSKSLFDVHPKLARAVIRAHIAEKRAEQEALNRQAWREAEGAVPASAEEGERETR